MKHSNRKENKTMSRVSDLEKKVDSLERNVGMLAKEAGIDDCLKIAEYSSIAHYKEGIEYALKQEEVKEIKRELESRRRELESQFVKSNLKSNISFVINKKPIYEYEGKAIYDLHIPAGTHFVFRGNIFVSKGIIRGLNKNDILDIILEDHSDFYNKDIIQDMHNPSDLYLIDKTK